MAQSEKYIAKSKAPLAEKGKLTSKTPAMIAGSEYQEATYAREFGYRFMTRTDVNSVKISMTPGTQASSVVCFVVKPKDSGYGQDSIGVYFVSTDQ